MADVRYTVTDLGVPPSFERASARVINDRGQIIGYLWAEDTDQSHAFWWEDGLMRDMGCLRLDGLNNLGMAVGTQSDAQEEWLCFAVMLENGSIGPLFQPQKSLSEACDINDTGQVIGHSSDGQVEGWAGVRLATAKSRKARSTAFVSRDGKGRYLPIPTGYRLVEVIKINNHGLVVGHASLAQDETLLTGQAALWHGKTITLLDSLDGTHYSEAVDINSIGDVLVRAVTRRGNLGDQNDHRYFLWNDGKKREIQGRCFTAINNRGQVVGSSARSDDDFLTGDRVWASLWQHGTLYDLNDLVGPLSGWELMYANDINNIGQIVGNGFHHGQSRAFLLTPITQIKEPLG